jgi:hypothetical protein
MSVLGLSRMAHDGVLADSLFIFVTTEEGMHISLSSFSVSFSTSVVDPLQLSPSSFTFILPIFSSFTSDIEHFRLSHSQGAPSVIS